MTQRSPITVRKATDEITDPMKDISIIMNEGNKRGVKLTKMFITKEKFDSLLKTNKCKCKRSFVSKYRKTYPSDQHFKIIIT